jgi:hypothetical protein
MDKDLNIEEFYREFGVFRSGLIKKIFESVGNTDRRMLTCHGMTVMNGSVLENFKLKFMKTKKLSYSNLIEIAPYEYTWYNAWLQKCNIIKIVGVEPFFKTYHMRIEYTLSRLRNISQKDLSRKYVGIILNSNWKPKAPPHLYVDPSLPWKLTYKIMEKFL